MDVSSIALQGLEQAQAQLDGSAARLATIGANTPNGGGVDTMNLSQEMLGLLSAKSQFALNIDVLKIADDMERKAIDLLG